MQRSSGSLGEPTYATVAAFNAGTVKETQTLVYDAFGR